MDSALVSVLINLGAGFLVVVLMILGFLVPKPTVQRLLEENENLKAALATERQRSDEIARAAAVTNQLIGALTSMADHERNVRAIESGRKDTDL